MSFEDLIIISGGFGRFQRLLTFGLIPFTMLVIATAYTTNILILIIPPHRCNISSNNSFNDFSEHEVVHVFHENKQIYSNGVLYDFTDNFPTYSSQNNLVCENAWKMYTVHTFYWTGSIFGTILFGIINDKYGRKKSYQLAVSMTLIADIMTYLFQDYIPFLIARFFSAAGDVFIATIAFVLAIEHCIPSKRRLNIFVWSFSYAIASLGVVWISYAVQNWEYLLIISWIPSAIAICISFFIPESPSWLMIKGREDEAVKNIERMARINGKHLNRDYIINHLRKSFTSTGKGGTGEDELENNEMSFRQTLCVVLKSSNLRKRIFFLGVLWFTASACYNGNSLEFQNLPYSMYVTYSIGALMEIPGNFFNILTLDKFGRRWINSGCFIIAGILGIMSANVSNPSLIIVLVMIMRGCYSSAFDITFSYSSEVVPTVIRGRALSFIRTCGGIGNAISPFVVSLAEKDALLPLMCFGVGSFLAGLLMLTMPETAKQQLPQTIEEGENFGKGQPFWTCPFSTSNLEENLQHQNPFGKNRVKEEIQIQCITFKQNKQ